MFDFHMHTHVSFDGRDTAVNMANAALKAGLREICFTDHMDYDLGDPNRKLHFELTEYWEGKTPYQAIGRSFENTLRCPPCQSGRAVLRRGCADRQGHLRPCLHI